MIIDVSAEVGSRTSGDLSQESKLRNTSVLNLNIAETVETLLVGAVEQSQGIEESKRRLGSKLTLEGVESGGGGAGLGGRCKGSGGAD